MSSCTPTTPMMATTNTPWAGVETLLEASIPGISIISSLAKSYLHLDITALLAYIIPLAAVVAACQYLYNPVTSFATRHCFASAEIRSDDEMYNYVMYWLSQQPFAAKTLGFVAGTKTDSDLVWNYWDQEEESERDHGDVETDWQLAEDDFDQYWQKLTARDRVKPLFFTPCCDGRHWFKYKGRWIAYTRESKELTMVFSAVRTETIYLTSYGRDTTILKDLLRDAQKTYIERDGSSTLVYRKYGDRDEWQRCMARPPRPISTVVLDKNQKEAIVEDIKEYLHPLTKRWYANRGIPYRRGYLLYGPPGTGKTSLCVALAGMFRLKVYVASLNSKKVTEESLATLFGLLPTRCVVLLEDVDSAGITHKRGPDSSTDTEKSEPSKENPIPSTDSQPTGISLSALLNVIDGVASSEGRILIMTTNHVEKLDPALLRPGRVDMSIAFQNATSETAQELFRSTYISREEDYPATRDMGKELITKKRFELLDHEITNLAATFATKIPSGEFSPADVQGYLLKHKSTPAKAVEGIEDWIVKTREEKLRQRKAEKTSEEAAKSTEKKAEPKPTETTVGKAETETKVETVSEVKPVEGIAIEGIPTPPRTPKPV